jgi:hypothetical protein
MHALFRSPLLHLGIAFASGAFVALLLLGRYEIKRLSDYSWVCLDRLTGDTARGRCP